MNVRYLIQFDCLCRRMRKISRIIKRMIPFLEQYFTWAWNGIELKVFRIKTLDPLDSRVKYNNVTYATFFFVNLCENVDQQMLIAQLVGTMSVKQCEGNQKEIHKPGSCEWGTKCCLNAAILETS